MSSKTKDWQRELIKKYRLPKDEKSKSILNKKQLSQVLKKDGQEKVYNGKDSKAEKGTKEESSS